MKTYRNQIPGLLITITGFILLVSCNNQNENGNTTSNNVPADSVKNAEATIAAIFPDTTVNGSARFTRQSNGMIKLEVQLTIPSKANKQVAVHIHQDADCGDHGEDAGGHWNPTNEMHGKWGTDHFHLGDIGNISLDASGQGSLTLETDKWAIGTNNQTDILNKALIVHGGVDDYTSQPSGSAGTRIGCAVIKEVQSNM